MTDNNGFRFGGMWPVLIVLLAMLGFGSVAKAAEFESGSYLAIGAGQYQQDSELNFNTTKNNKAVFGVVGYSVSDWLSAEVGYVDFDRIRYVLGGGVTNDVENNSFYVRANLQIPLRRQDKEMTAITLSGGGHHWDARQEVSDSTGTIISTTRSKGESPLLGAGLLVRNRDTAFRLEYIIFKEVDETSKIDMQLLTFNMLFYLQ